MTDEQRVLFQPPFNIRLDRQYYENDKIVINKREDSKIDYDLVLLTRFDLIFNDNFNESNIKLDKFNIVSELESKHFICDNFYLFPFKYLREFLEIAKDYRTTLKGYHVMRGAIEKRLNTKINMIKNEKKQIVDLTFYTIAYKLRPHPRLR